MSFQRFRVSTTAPPAPTVQAMSAATALPATTAAGPSTGGHFQGVSFRVHFPDDIAARSSGAASQSGPDALDGPEDFRRYTHKFESLAAFQAWRAAEEAEHTVEFVLSDRHTSKATPPRFKEHVKLVCGRHGKNGRKKYEKKFPARKRRWESLKIEGEGCPASITYKTFEGTDEVRVIYVSEHSHPIGEDNLAYTKKGRKLLMAKGGPKPRSHSGPTPSGSPNAGGSATPDASPPQPLTHMISGPSSFALPLQFVSQRSPTNAPPLHTDHGRAPSFGVFPLLSAPPSTFALPPHAFLPSTDPSSAGAPPPGGPPEDAHERWERLSTLFQSVRDAARSFAFPPASVAALESVLVRLYVESPVVAAAGAALSPPLPAPPPGGVPLLPPGAGLPPAATQVHPPPEPLTPRTPETPRPERLEEDDSEYASLSGE